MNKIFKFTFLLIIVFLTGCAGNQTNIKSETSAGTKVIQESNIFNHELFSIELPAPHTADKSVIQPINDKDFPEIIFGISNNSTKSENLLQVEEEWFKNLCGQTDACGKIVSSETITINGRTGIKFIVQYQGRSLDEMKGYLYEYHYSIFDAENLFRFWTSASDLESPEEVSKAFDKIIGTISFK